MNTKLYDEDVPSKRSELLKKVEGLTLDKLVRFSWWTVDESAKQCKIEPKNVFSLTAGPLLLYFDCGLVIGASSDPSKSSVIIWTERNEDGEVSEYPVEEDAEYSPIDAKDKIYSNRNWDLIIGQKVRDVKVIKRDPENAKYIDLPNEVGVLFTMDNETRFLLSHGLHNNSDDFSVIFENQIRHDILPRLCGLV